MTLFLGIDGGGTGCRAAVCDASGQILGEGQGGPANIASDYSGARENILSAARAALPTTARLEDLQAVLGLAGANVGQMAARLAADLPFRSARVESDALIAVKGALQGSDGVVASLGTGSVFAVQRAGKVRQIGGWGLILGDEGSGAWLGRTLLATALRAIDGFVPASPLTTALLDEMGGTDGVIDFAQSARPVDFARLAPRLVGSDDPAACAILARADAEIAAAIDLLAGADRLPVVFLGGLGGLFAQRLSGRWQVTPPLGTALEGALWMARQG